MWPPREPAVRSLITLELSLPDGLSERNRLAKA